MKNQLKLWFFGMSLGLKSILKLKKLNKRILEMIITPMNYWRCIETPLILNGLNPKKEDLILDIGSPKLLSFYLSKKIGSKIIASDINDYFMSYCKDFSKTLNLDNKKYNLQIIDGRKTKLKSNSVDKIYSLSVFEHIPENGDTKAIKEAKRILKKGGIIILTLPYQKTYRIDYRESKEFYYSQDINKKTQNINKVFYQRRYDEQTLNERIIRSSRMKVVEKQYFGQRIRLPNGNWISYLGPINLLSSKLNHMGKIKNDNKSTKIEGVYLVLRK